MRHKPQSRKYFLGIEVIQANAGAGCQVPTPQGAFAQKNPLGGRK